MQDITHMGVVMKETVGVIKEIDKLGRIVIPKEMRDRLGFGTKVEVVLMKEGILLRNSEFELIKIGNKTSATSAE